MNANTLYHFRVAALDTQNRIGTPTADKTATTSASLPGNPPQPKFKVYTIEQVGASYRVWFSRSTSPVYTTAYDPTFDLSVGTTEANMAYDSTGGLSDYFYYDVVPGSSRWYGFVANYGPQRASTMQKIHVAALGQSSSVSADGVNWLGNVHMNWSSVPRAGKCRIYHAPGGPYPGQSWFDFKVSAGANLHYYGSTTSTSANLIGLPGSLTTYFFVVAADSAGVESWYCKYAISGVIYPF